MDGQKNSLTFDSSHSTGVYRVNKKRQTQPDCSLVSAHTARGVTRSSEVDATRFHILK